MNQQAYDAGKAAYQSGDWLKAVASLSDAKEPGEVNGAVDHLIGNAYMKLGRYESAADAYASALSDTAYGKVGALSCNRGRALLAAGRAQEAVQALTTAVQDASYSTPYKAYLALGRAYEASGDVRNAGIAYRSAAIDENNPAPAGALSDLGSCFMRLGRPVDAVEAYRTALDFTTPLENQSRVYCDLGLAYVAANRMPEAVDAFTHATSDPSFVMSPEAQASFDAARKAIAVAAAKQQQSGSAPSDTDAFLAAAGYGTEVDPLDPTGASGQLIPSAEDTGFFSVTEEELVAQDKKDRKVKRKHKHRGLKVFLFILILLVLIGGGAAFAYTQGFGWPTQESVAESLFQAKTDGTEISRYIAPSASAQAQAISDTLPVGAQATVDGVDRSMNETTVHVVAKLSGGGEQQYTVNMVRDGISWKVVSVNTEYSSQTGNNLRTKTRKAKEPDVSLRFIVRRIRRGPRHRPRHGKHARRRARSGHCHQRALCRRHRQERKPRAGRRRRRKAHDWPHARLDHRRAPAQGRRYRGFRRHRGHAPVLHREGPRAPLSLEPEAPCRRMRPLRRHFRREARRL